MDIAPALCPKIVTCSSGGLCGFHLCVPSKTYLLWIAAKIADALLDPLQCCQLVLQTQVERATFLRFLPLGEAERTKAVVQTNVEDRCPLRAVQTFVSGISEIASEQNIRARRFG